MGYYGVVLLLVVVGAAACVLCSDLRVPVLQETGEDKRVYNEQTNIYWNEERCEIGKRFILAECIVCTCGADGLVVKAQPCEQMQCTDYINPPYRTLKADIAAARNLPGTYKYPTSEGYKVPGPEMPNPGNSDRSDIPPYIDNFPSDSDPQPVTPDARNNYRFDSHSTDLSAHRRWWDPQPVIPDVGISSQFYGHSNNLFAPRRPGLQPVIPDAGISPQFYGHSNNLFAPRRPGLQPVIPDAGISPQFYGLSTGLFAPRRPGLQPVIPDAGISPQFYGRSNDLFAPRRPGLQPVIPDAGISPQFYDHSSDLFAYRRPCLHPVSRIPEIGANQYQFGALPLHRCITDVQNV